MRLIVCILYGKVRFGLSDLLFENVSYKTTLFTISGNPFQPFAGSKRGVFILITGFAQHRVQHAMASFLPQDALLVDLRDSG